MVIKRLSVTYIDVTLGLHEISHDAKDRTQTAIVSGMIWPLPSSELGRMILFQIEVCASILECESAIFADYCTSESSITGVEGESLALFSNGEVYSVGVVVSRTPMLVSGFMLIFVTINLSPKTVAFLGVRDSSDKSILN